MLTSEQLAVWGLSFEPQACSILSWALQFTSKNCQPRYLRLFKHLSFGSFVIILRVSSSWLSIEFLAASYACIRPNCESLGSGPVSLASFSPTRISDFIISDFVPPSSLLRLQPPWADWSGCSLCPDTPYFSNEALWFGPLKYLWISEVLHWLYLTNQSCLAITWYSI